MSGRRYLYAVRVFFEGQRDDGALGIGSPELVAFVDVAAAVEGPTVTRAHELVAGYVTLGEIAVEMRAEPRPASEPAAVSAPHDAFLTIDFDRLDRAGRQGVYAHSVCRCAVDDTRQRFERRAERNRAPEDVAQQRRVRTVAAGVRGHARQAQELLGIIRVDREGVRVDSRRLRDTRSHVGDPGRGHPA